MNYNDKLWTQENRIWALTDQPITNPLTTLCLCHVCNHGFDNDQVDYLSITNLRIQNIRVNLPNFNRVDYLKPRKS